MTLACLALAAALVAGDVEDTYRKLVDQAVTAGQAGQTVEARTALDRAIALIPERAEAWAERGAAFFVEADYARAVHDLERAVGLQKDPWTRELLASAYLLAGRADDALASWNRVGGPLLRHVVVQGGSVGVQASVRREVACEEGKLLRLADLRRARSRIRDLPVVERATLRLVTVGDGVVDLVVAVTERRGPGGSLPGLLMTSLPPLAFETLRLELGNAFGSGMNVAGSWRFDEKRPEISLGVEVARPLGLPVILSAGGWRGHQTYEAEGRTSVWRSRGGGFSLRRALGSRTVARLGGRIAYRSAPRADDALPDIAPGGGSRLVVAEAGLDGRVVDRWRLDVDAGVRLQHSGARLGSAADYWRATLTVSGVFHLAPPEDVVLERSDLLVRLRTGRASGGVPLDESFHPGAGQEAEFSLRGRRRLVDGVLNAPASSRDLQVLNVEWRPRLHRSRHLSIAGAVFVDSGRTWNWSRRLSGVVDAGVGLRIATTAGPVLRIDWGRGVLDDSMAVTFGLQRAF